MSAHPTPVVLQVLPAMNSGGVERGTVEIARALKAAGWKAVVASSGGVMVPQVAYSGATHIEIPTLKSKNPLTIWRNIARLKKIILEQGVNIVHARSRAPAWAAFFAARATGCQFVTTFHGTYGAQNYFKRAYNRIMTRGDRVIAISHFIADHIAETYEVAGEHVRIIHRGVDLNHFNPDKVNAERLSSLSKEWRLPEDLPLILFPGRLTRWKGQNVFLKSLAALPHRHFFCILLGDDSEHPTYRAELEKLITSSNLEGHVRIAHHTALMNEAYTLARLVVATSLDPEAFGRVPIEAHALGKPVIATNHGGACETVIHGITGWLVEPGNEEELTRTLDFALNLTPEEQDSMRRVALERAQSFSAAEMCRKTLDVYRELLATEASLEAALQD